MKDTPGGDCDRHVTGFSSSFFLYASAIGFQTATFIVDNNRFKRESEITYHQRVVQPLIFIKITTNLRSHIGSSILSFYSTDPRIRQTSVVFTFNINM